MELREGEWGGSDGTYLLLEMRKAEDRVVDFDRFSLDDFGHGLRGRDVDLDVDGVEEAGTQRQGRDGPDG
jgi:hypothetical protein